MNWDWDSIGAKLDTIHANQLVILRLLLQLRTKEHEMAIDLSKLTAEVANNTTVEGSVVTLLNQLTAIIKAIPPSTDPTTQAALDQLTATLAANDTALAGAVTANTPAPPAS